MECTLVLQWQAVDGRPQAWPDTTTLQAWPLRRSLALALFRISQEALTNVTRHARATRVRVRIGVVDGSLVVDFAVRAMPDTFLDANGNFAFDPTTERRGNYALAAARALADSDKDAETIVRRALDIAADICVYTNRNLTVEVIERR